MADSHAISKALYAGVDVGGTNAAVGLLDAEGRLLEVVKRPTEAELGGDALASKLADMISGLLDGHGADGKDLKAVGLGIPGFLDPERGVVMSAANLNMHDYPIAGRLSAHLGGTPVSIDNDVRMYIYGEAMTGAAAGYQHVFGVTVGTGLAAATINKGEILYGAGYLAGEIGHHTVDGNSYVCGCGMTGCLETLVSAGGIVRQARDRGLNVNSAGDVSKAYDAGDPAAIEVFEHTGLALGRALSVVATLLSPDIIVIGGGVSLAGERLLGPVRRALNERTHPLYGERIVLAPAKWNDEAGIIGSAMSAKARSERLT